MLCRIFREKELLPNMNYAKFNTQSKTANT